MLKARLQDQDSNILANHAEAGKVQILMTSSDASPNTLKHMFQAHPWHGVSPGAEAPRRVNAYIEIVPTDAVKYELDKLSGHLHVDRPQRFSSMCPSLYGLIPQTLDRKSTRLNSSH